MILISFYLEGILSILIKVNYLIPLTTLMSLIIIYPYLSKQIKKYYIICFITGLLYDIAYTNTGILNAFIFLLMGYIIQRLRINKILLTIIIITIYRIITYSILVFVDYLKLDVNTLLNSILYSYILNITYVIIIMRINKKIKHII